MSASEIYGALPDWYRTERDCEKIISKLNTVDDLDYYIRNADEFIRRIALLRLKNLDLRESARIFKEIMDDPVESHSNKDIAAWALKSHLAGNEPDLLTNTRYLARYTGQERYEELFSLKLQEQTDISFQFAQASDYSAFGINNEDSTIERDIFFDAKFDLNGWIKDLIEGIVLSFRKLLKSIFPYIKKSILQLVKTKKSIPNVISKPISSLENNIEVKTEAIPQVNQSLIYSKHRRRRRSNLKRSYGIEDLRINSNKRPGFFTFVKKGVYQLFYLLLFPLRFVLKHKLASFCILAAVYAFFTYSSYGRALAYKYTGTEISELQRQLFEKGKTYYFIAVNEINKFAGVDDWKKDNKAEQENDDPVMAASLNSNQQMSSSLYDETIYEVTAKDGLNIRTAPDPYSEKVNGGPLPFDTTVICISVANSVPSGSEWYYVESEDGRNGWVSAKYLKKAEGR